MENETQQQPRQEELQEEEQRPKTRRGLEDKPTMTWAELAVIVIGVATVLFIAFLALLDYSGYGKRWMGFSESTTTKKTTNYDPSETKVKSIAYADDTQRAKTVWDWMQVAGFPLAVAAATFLWTQAAKRRDEKLAHQRAQEAEKLAHRRAQDAVLQSYLNQMAVLLIDKGLHSDPREHGDTRVTARAQTYSVLSQLDGDRKRFVLQFLREARLIMKDQQFLEGRTIQPRVVGLTNVDLEDADLSGIKLADTSLERVNLKNANLSNSDLSGANLSRAELSEANLDDADLSYTDLTCAEVTDKQLNTILSYKGAYCSIKEAYCSYPRKHHVQEIDLRRRHHARLVYLNNEYLKGRSDSEPKKGFLGLLYRWLNVPRP